jgi:hypothetical protein
VTLLWSCYRCYLTFLKSFFCFVLFCFCTHYLSLSPSLSLIISLPPPCFPATYRDTKCEILVIKTCFTNLYIFIMLCFSKHYWQNLLSYYYIILIILILIILNILH